MWLRRFERLTKLGQLGLIQIGYRPKRHAVMDPVTNVESSKVLDAGLREHIIQRWGDKYVDGVPLPLIDECGHWPSADVIEAAPDERKPDRGEIRNRGRKIELPEEPRFDSVLIRGLHIEQVVRHQRTDVAVHHVVRDRVAAR